MTEERPSWDEYFMEIAHIVKKRSTCLRRKVGAVLVKDRRILATGYNGAPKGLPHCAEVGCMRIELNIPSGERHELCLTPEVEILTEEGFKAIRDVIAGERVMTHEGVFRPVEKVIVREYNGPVLVIKPKGLLPVRLTPEHPVLAIRTVRRVNDRKAICKEACVNRVKERCSRPFQDYKEEWVPAACLNYGDLLVFCFDNRVCKLKELDLAKYVDPPPDLYIRVLRARESDLLYCDIDEIYGMSRAVAWQWMHGSAPRSHIIVRNGMLHMETSSSKDIPAVIEVNPDLLWLFGMYLAEGYSSGNQVVFCLNVEEGELAERIVSIMKEHFGLTPYKRGNGASLRIVYSSKILATVFARMLGSNSYDMRLPQDFMLLPPSLQYYIFSGWIQGDGHEDDHEICATTTSRILALQMFQICLRLGKIPSLDVQPPGPRVRSKMYRLVLKKRPKVATRYLRGNKLYTPVSQIRIENYHGAVYNLEVSEAHSYTTTSFVVHNCRGVHAEQNAIIQAAVFGVSTKGATLYCTTFPCVICAKMIINAEIKEVVYDDDYEDKLAKKLLEEAGIKVRRFRLHSKD